jgi:FlaA1/EpsC-like NDP-sugar epimerase
MLITTLITTAIFIKLGLYRAVVRFMAAKAFSNLAMGITISALILASASFLNQANLPRSSIVIYWFTAFALLGIPRLFIRNIVRQLNNSSRESVLVYGAGNQGIALVNALTNSDQFCPIAFIDDDKKKQGTVINSLKVHSSKDSCKLAEQFSAKKNITSLR